MFTDGVELLGYHGWVELKKVQVGDVVMQFNYDGTMSPTNVLNKHESSYYGPTYRFFDDFHEILVTPNHYMVTPDRNGEYKSGVFAENLMVFDDIPRSAKIANGTINKLEPMERLYIVKHLVAFAKFDRLSLLIHMSDRVRAERLEWILKEGEISYKHNDGDYTIALNDIAPPNLKSKTVHWCKDFVRELMFWNHSALVNSSREFVDVSQMVATAAGTVCITAKTKLGYAAFFVENGITDPMDKEVVMYAGPVADVTVNSGMLVARYNGKVFIS